MDIDTDSSLSIAGLYDHITGRLQLALQAVGVTEEVSIELVTPPKPEMGDLGFACFPLARLLRKAPTQIAAQLAETMAPDAVIEAISTAGPYLNFRLNKQMFIRVVLSQVLREKERFGGDQADPPASWMVEYSSPNTNKPLHLGHLRNNLLGASVSRLLRHYGHGVAQITLVNDRGVHICKSMLAYQKWGEGTDPDEARQKGDHLVGHFYVLFDKHFNEEYATWLQTDEAATRRSEWLDSRTGKAAQKEAAKNPKAPAPEQAFVAAYKDTYFNTASQLGAEVREMLRGWEAGDEVVRELWQRMNDWVLAGFDQTYERLGVSFDQVQRESETYKLGKEIVCAGLEAGALSTAANGAVICDLTKVGLKGEKVLLRGDGTSVYMTQDLGTAVERFDKFELDQLVYVVGDEQNYHFDVLFRILGLLRPGLAERCHHLSYGMIRLPEGKMKSREGTVVDADDLMDEVHALAREETEQRAKEGKAHTEGISDTELDHRAEQIGMAALKYFLLKFSPGKSFEYKPKESIDFLGQTGPYCLFNYARTRSLLRKAGGEPALDTDALARLGTDRELELVRLLAAFPEVVERAVNGLDPSRIAEYCFDLCKSFAFVFTDKDNHPIVTCDDAQLRHGRLLMVAAIGHTLRTALELLGIEVLEEM